MNLTNGKYKSNPSEKSFAKFIKPQIQCYAIQCYVNANRPPMPPNPFTN